MSKQNYKVQHKKSSVLGKQPTSDKLEYGELGINYNKDSVGVYLKNSDNKIVQVGGDMSSLAKSSDLDTKQDKLEHYVESPLFSEIQYIDKNEEGEVTHQTSVCANPSSTYMKVYQGDNESFVQVDNTRVLVESNAIILRNSDNTDENIRLNANGIQINTIDEQKFTYNGNEVAVKGDISDKQDKLVSGTNIKTINHESILGKGNITISGGDGKVKDVQVNGTSILNQTTGIANITSIPTPQEKWDSYTEGNYIYQTKWGSGLDNSKVIPNVNTTLGDKGDGKLRWRWMIWGDDGYGKLWGDAIPTATTTSDGVMSSADKTKLDGINLSNYYTKTEANNKYAEKDDVPSFKYYKEYEGVSFNTIDNEETFSTINNNIGGCGFQYGSIIDGGMSTESVLSVGFDGIDATTTNGKVFTYNNNEVVTRNDFKTINNQSILGTGNIDVSGGGGGGLVDDVRIGETSLVNDRVAVITEATTSAAGVMSASDKTKLDGIDLSLYYTKTEADGKYAGKDDVPSTVYNKTEVNNLLNFKANSADVYTKSEADEKFATKGSGGDGKVKDVQVDGATVLDETTGIASIDLTSKANVDLSNISDTGNMKIVNIVKENSLKLLNGHEETNAFLSIDANNKLKLEGIYDIERVFSEAFNKVKESVGLTDKLEYDAGATFSIASGNNVSESLRSVDNELIQINNVKKLTLVKLVYNGTDIKDKNDTAAVYSGTQYYNKLIDLLNDTSKLVTLEITVAGSEETWLMPSIESSGRVVFSGKFKDVYENTDGTVSMEDSQFINRLKTIFQEK